jgi:hypothetical protein
LNTGDFLWRPSQYHISMASICRKLTLGEHLPSALTLTIVNEKESQTDILNI